MEQGEIVNIIIDTINTILGNIISSIDNSMYSSLDSVIFIGPDIIKNSSFEKLTKKVKIISLKINWLGFSMLVST